MLRLNIWRVALALAYFGTAKLGLGLAEATQSVTAIWPPTGLALVALVLGGRRMWPAIAVGAFAANATTDVTVYSALGIAVGNTLEAVVGASLLAWVGFRPTLRRLRDIFALVALAAIFSTTISATIGVASVSLGDSLPGTWSAWRVWWLGDMGGDLLVAPFLFVAITHWPYREAPGRALEAVALIGGLVVVGLIVFAQSTPVGYLTFPFFIWAALRFLQPGATTAALVTAALAVAYTAGGESQFVLASEDDSLLLAQTFSAVIGLSALILATVMGQRRQGERAVRELAHTLQAELLPPQLPEIPQMETAAWYRAGMREQEVGGDFYDVFEAAPGHWVAVIGDVCGKGPEAASLTALARYTLRAVDRERSEPSEALRTLNDAILAQRADQRFMTVALAHVSANGGGEHSVTVSNGGHPLPLIVRADGEVREVGTPGTLLGIYPDPRLANHRVEMGPGDALVLFTDGLSERRDFAEEHTERIWEMLRSTAGADAAQIAEGLKRITPTHDEVADDVAVLVLRRPTERPVVAVDLDPVPESAARARAAIAPLEGVLTPDLYANLRLLVTELVTNSVRHARLRADESIHLLVEASPRILRVEVSDPGVGFEQETPRPALDGSGGFGLYIADRLADQWGVTSEDGQTSVWLEKDLGPEP